MPLHKRDFPDMHRVAVVQQCAVPVAAVLAGWEFPTPCQVLTPSLKESVSHGKWSMIIMEVPPSGFYCNIK